MYRHIEKDEKKLTDEKIELTQKAVRKSVGQETAVVNMLNDEMEMLILSLGYRKESDTAKEIYAQVLEWSPVGENYHWFITTLENWLKEKYGLEVE